LPATAEVVPAAPTTQPTTLPESTHTPTAATLERKAAARLSPTPTRPSPALGETPSGSAGPNAPKSRRGILAGGLVALVGLTVAGWLYTLIHRGEDQ